MRFQTLGLATLLLLSGCSRSLSEQPSTQPDLSDRDGGNRKELRFLIKEAARKSSKNFEADIKNGLFKIYEDHEKKRNSDPRDVRRELEEEKKRLVLKHPKSKAEIEAIIDILVENLISR